MTYPSADLTNTHTDAATDDPSQARAEINAAILKINAMITATGTGINNVLKLDSAGKIPTGVVLADAVAIASGGTGAATAAGALVNLGLTALAAEINYNDISTLGLAQASKTVTTNSSNNVSLGGVSVLHSVTGGTTTVYTITTGITAYESNRVYEVRVHAKNTGGCTINFDTLGAKTIKLLSGVALVAGQFYGIARLHYNGIHMILQNPAELTGSWSPVYEDGYATVATMAGSTAGAYQLNGDWVDYQGYATGSSMVGMTGTISIGGLPYTSSSPRWFAGSIGAVFNANMSAGHSINSMIVPGTTIIQLHNFNQAGGSEELLVVSVTASLVIYFSGRYRKA